MSASHYNVLVCGFTGIGKTSLIQAATKTGTVPDSAIGHAEATTRGFVSYETEANTYIDSEGLENGKSMDEFIDRISGEMNRRLDSGAEEALIHAIWFCVDGTRCRMQPRDRDFISRFAEKIVLVVTKSDDMRQTQFEGMSRELAGLIAPERTVFVSGLKRTGIQQLLDATQKVVEHSLVVAGQEIAEFRAKWNNYYAEKVSEVKSRCAEAADSYINWAAGRAAAVAISPLPLADLPVLAANEVYMIYKVGSAYGYSVDSTMITAILGAAGASFAGKLMASFIPGLKIAVAAATTYGVGKAAKYYFESGMTLDAKALKQKFNESKKEAGRIDWSKSNGD